ncbi:oligomeric Golgi complex subunit 3-like [Oopsacas minuta]|uniref:Conserved oligomeric Golgi complex subunit 3 n=1 Tax=Oopsacas minuta TaxID=111878 RepID=A0AAV7JP22_9METZ|nr:oligomeric Golgi complex subunit 3-like [Oopsacas minuta]
MRTLQTQAPSLKLKTELFQVHSFCDDVVSQISEVQSNLSNILDNYEQVKKRTESLHSSCTSLMNETTDLLNCAENISIRLQYFDELEEMNRQLNSPSVSVTSDSFVPMLARLDECIDFMQRHQDYKDATVHLAKFDLALSKALGLIRSYIVGVFKSVSESILQAQKASVIETHPSIFYGKFKSYGCKVKIILEELEQRALKNQEFSTLLSDCHLSYFQQRINLVMPMVSEYLNSLEKQCCRDISSLVRSGCLYVCQLCLDEYQLYIHFFSTGGHAISQILSSLCSYFYEFVRPICIRLVHLETLTSLCDIISNEILENKVKLHEGVLVEFASMTKLLLQDIQQRFIYRAQKYIHSDIAAYKPIGGDLAYPDKLVLARKIGIGLERGLNEIPSPLSEVASVSSIG